MLLAVDIGNSSIKFGIFDAEKLLSKFSIPSLSNNITSDVNSRIDVAIKSAIVCSVVPDANDRIAQFIKRSFGIDAFFVTNDLDLDLDIKHVPREAAGTDRLVNSFAAAEKYGVPCVVCSFGTATTIDVVNKERVLLGGVIAPGMSLAAKALDLHTAKLPYVEPAMPETVIGRTTEDCIRSGNFYSQVGLIETVITKIKKDIGNAQVIATGGNASLVAGGTNAIDVVDETLTLDGLRMIAERR